MKIEEFLQVVTCRCSSLLSVSGATIYQNAWGGIPYCDIATLSSVTDRFSTNHLPPGYHILHTILALQLFGGLSNCTIYEIQYL